MPCWLYIDFIKHLFSQIFACNYPCGTTTPCRYGYFTKKFADSTRFREDPVVATPDVTELVLGDSDEFVIIATDGLWCAVLC